MNYNTFQDSSANHMAIADKSSIFDSMCVTNLTLENKIKS